VNTKDYHDFSGRCIDSVMKEVLMSKSMDNLTAVLVTLEGFYNFFYELAVKSNYLKIRHDLKMHDLISKKNRRNLILIR